MLTRNALDDRLLAAALFVGVVLIWGTTWFAIHLQDNGTPAPAAVAVRFAIAAGVMWAFVLATGRRVVVPAGAWPVVVIHGLTFFCFNYLLIYLATRTVPSGLVSVLFSTVILFSLAWEVALLRAFPGWSALAAAAMGIAGLALLFEHEILAGSIDPRGALTVLAAALVASTGNALSRRLMDRGMGIVSMQTTGMTIGAGAMLVIALVRGDLARLVLEPVFVGALIYLALFGSVAAFALYFLMVRRMGPTRAAYSTVFFPLVALAISAAFESYAMTAAGWVGVLLLMAGAALVVGRKH
jgi:drug/metabolite transporter (DMT)-like permease